MQKIDFDKYENGLVPTIVQDANSSKVLMLGFMNAEALEKTTQENRVCFFSRSKNRLWTKGETSGNFLQVQSILIDCDADTILIKAIPTGPVCHTGQATCFGEDNLSFSVHTIEGIIADRKNNPNADSYVSGLFAKGINKIAQKVGEEAVELVIESKDNNDTLFIEEAADLFFHYLILLQAKNKTMEDVLKLLQQRHHSK
jgi:phosphoribosyl-AMP cyclohydrolase / phosphoribosyl-ATP pyrophosphohydrolase